MSIDFVPVKVGPRRRRVDALTVGVLAVVVAVGASIVKPWEAGGAPAVSIPPSVAAAASSLAVPVPSLAASVPSAAPSPALPPLEGGPIPQADPFRGAPPPTYADLKPALATHDTWGVRAILVSWRGFQPEPRPRYLERWSSAAPDGIDTAHIVRDNRQIVALGMTFPSGYAPTDPEIWRVVTSGELERIDTRRVERGDGLGSFLFLRSDPSSSGFIAWDPGIYWIDSFVDGELRRIAAIVPQPLAAGPLTDDGAAARGIGAGQPGGSTGG